MYLDNGKTKHCMNKPNTNCSMFNYISCNIQVIHDIWMPIEIYVPIIVYRAQTSVKHSMYIVYSMCFFYVCILFSNWIYFIVLLRKGSVGDVDTRRNIVWSASFSVRVNSEHVLAWHCWSSAFHSGLWLNCQEILIKMQKHARLQGGF